MPRFTYFANWKAYAFAYTPSVDTVMNAFTITLSYVKTTGSYYIGLPNKQYDTLYAGKNRTIQGAIWKSAKDSSKDSSIVSFIYENSSIVTYSTNVVNLSKDCTNYAGYDDSKEYNKSTFTFNSVLLETGETYYIGVYDIDSAAGKLYDNNKSTVMIAVDSESADAQQLYDCVDTASGLSRSRNGSTPLKANVSFNVTTKPKLNIEFINFIDNRKSLTARFNLSSSSAIPNDYLLCIGYRSTTPEQNGSQASSTWTYILVGKYASIGDIKTIELGYSKYDVKFFAAKSIFGTPLAESDVIKVDGRKPSVHISTFSYNTGVTGRRLPLLVSFNGGTVVGNSLEYSYKYPDDTSYTSLGMFNTGRTKQMTISPTFDWGYIYFSVKNSAGVYSDDISQYFDCVNAKISNAHIVEGSITISSADISFATSHSPATTVSVECGSFSSTTKSKSTTQVLPITGLADGTNYSVYISVTNNINGSSQRALVAKFTTLSAVWKELLPIIYTGGHWTNVTIYIYSEEAGKFIECKPRIALSKD